MTHQLKQPVATSPELSRSIKRETEKLVQDAALYLCESFRMEPLSAVTTIADYAIFSVAEAAGERCASDYFEAVLDTIRHAGTPERDNAEARRQAAFADMAHAVQIKRLGKARQ